jgi:hypothetical protein
MVIAPILAREPDGERAEAYIVHAEDEWSLVQRDIQGHKSTSRHEESLGIDTI